MKQVYQWSFLLTLSLANGFAQDVSVDQKLQHAENFYFQKDYASTIQMIQPLLDDLKLSTLSHILLSHKLLGAAYCELGKNIDASNHFRTLSHFSKRETNLYLRSKACRHLYAEVQSPRFKAASFSAPEPKPLSQPKLKTHRFEWLSLSPLGIPQFRAQERTKAWLLFGTQTASIATMVTSFFLFRAEKGENGTFDKPGRAAFYRNLNWVALGLGGVSVSYGFYDGIKRNRAKKRRRLRIQGPRLQTSL